MDFLVWETKRIGWANGWRFVFVVRCSDLGNEGAWVANEWRFVVVVHCSDLERVLRHFSQLFGIST